MKTRLTYIAILFTILLSGCAIAQIPEAKPVPLRLDELTAWSDQKLSDDDVIAQVEQRGVAFVLSSEDVERLRSANVSDGVVRFLQGRASGEQALRAKIVSGKYRVPNYSGLIYRNYPYLGYYDGLHYYGGSRYRFMGFPYYGYPYYGGSFVYLDHHHGSGLHGGHGGGGHHGGSPGGGGRH